MAAQSTIDVAVIDNQLLEPVIAFLIVGQDQHVGHVQGMGPFDHVRDVIAEFRRIDMRMGIKNLHPNLTSSLQKKRVWQLPRPFLN